MGAGKNQNRLSILGLSGIALLIYGLGQSAAEAGNGPTLQTFPNFSRLVFPVHPQATFRIQADAQNSRKVVLGIEAPSMEAWGKTDAKDVLVGGVVVSRDASQSKEAVFDLAGQNSEYFAYFQPSPPAVVVDIWPSTSPEPQRTIASTPEPKKTVKPKATKAVEKPSIAFLDLKKNFFYEFPAVVPEYVYKGNNFNTEIERDPGSGWSWTEPNLEIPGGINFSLAQKLFARKQYSLAIKSVEFAHRDHPQSPYNDEMAYLEALSYRNLAIQEKNSFLLNRSEEQLKELMLKPSGKDGYLPFANKIRMYFASEAYRNQRWLDAISHFEFITTMKASAAETDYRGIVMASAEAYLALRQFRRAERIYRSVMTEVPKSDYAKEAVYRWGNLLSLERAFRKADETFDRAVKEYPEFEATREEAFFNQAEANFWLGNFKKAQSLFSKFIDRHPSNTLGGMTYVRLGELSEIVDKNLDKAKEFYTQASRRFPYSVGDTLGKIRLARASLPTETDLDYQIDTLKAIAELPQNPTPVRNMANEVLLEFLYKGERWPELVTRAEKAVADTVGTDGGEIFRSIFLRAIMGQVKYYNQQKQFSEALSFYKAKEKWFEHVGPEIFRELADSYRGLNLLGTSNQYMARYLEAVADSGRKPSSYNSDRDQAILMGARTEFLQGRYSAVLKSIEGQNDLESVRMRALSLEKLDRLDEARRVAEDGIAKLMKEMSDPSESRDRLLQDFTEVLISWHTSRKDHAANEVLLKSTIAALKKPSERFDFLYADSLWYQLKHRPASEAFLKAIERHPQSQRIDRANYRLALSYIALNERNVAVNVLTKLAESSQNIWARSAKQELDLLAWEQKYSVVLGDLPPAGLGIKR